MISLTAAAKKIQQTLARQGCGVDIRIRVKTSKNLAKNLNPLSNQDIK
jgi:hypothetical protein